MSLHWEDVILTRAAARLVVNGHEDAAQALLAYSELTVARGTSWWDGHDDYLYDLDLTISIDPAGVPALDAMGGPLRAALSRAVSTFHDANDELQRGDLVKLESVVREVTIDDDRLATRRETTANQVRFLRP